MSPLILGVLPFSLIVGVSSVGVGLSKFEAIAMCHIIFAGASQLAVVDLIGQHASVVVIILTGLVINLRFCVYSASLAPHFHGLPLYWRGGIAYLLTDQAFALSISAFEQDHKKLKHWFYLGVALSMWGVWHTGTMAGVFLGAQIPKSWSLDFAVPLTFLALLFPALKDRPSILAAVVAGLLALIGHVLPYNLGLFLATLGGITAGYLMERRTKNAL